MGVSPMMDVRVLTATLVGAAVVIAGCGSSSPAVTSATAQPSATARGAATTITTAAGCPGGNGASGSIELFPLDVSDNGRAFSMVRCQALEVLLRRSGDQAGCRWSDVQTSDEAVLRVLPIPLPLPPDGGTNLAFTAVAPGEATLTSSLACTSGVSELWSVTVTVAH